MNSAKWTMFGIIAFTVLAFAGQSAAELPPEIIADKHSIEAEQAQGRGDYVAAMKIMEKIIALQREHNFKLLDEFHFNYARIALRIDSFKVAFDAVSTYLKIAGRGGEHYRDALLLLMEVEKEVDGLPKINAEDTCTRKGTHEDCWWELASHPGCYVWAEDWTQTDWIQDKVKWSGKCSGQVPVGRGRLDWLDTSNPHYNQWERGRFRNGKRHGRWSRGFKDGRPYEWGEYVGGKREGTWFRLITQTSWDDNLTPSTEEQCHTVSFSQGVKASARTRVDLSKCKSR